MSRSRKKRKRKRGKHRYRHSANLTLDSRQPSSSGQDYGPADDQDQEVHTFRVMMMIEGMNRNFLEVIERELNSHGLVQLDTSKVAGPCLLFSEGERFACKAPQIEQWFVVVLYCGKTSLRKVRESGLHIEFQGEIISSIPGQMRMKGHGCWDFDDPVFIFLSDPRFDDETFHAADPTICLGTSAPPPILRPGADEFKVESGRPEFLVLSDNSYSNRLPSLRAARPRRGSPKG